MFTQILLFNYISFSVGFEINWDDMGCLVWYISVDDIIIYTLDISYDVFSIQHVLSQYDSWTVFVVTINTHCFTVH